MEISFCGPVRSNVQFMMKDFIKMGVGLGKVIAVYFGGKKINVNDMNNSDNEMIEVRKLLK